MAASRQMTETNWGRIRPVDGALAGVLLVAGALRMANTGMYQLVVDEATILLDGINLGRNWQWTWQSSSIPTWKYLPRHSPLNVYLTAIPYLFSPDPRLARLWVAVLGVAAIAVMYWLMRRYFGRRAAVVTGLLLAVHAPLVDWSRFVWNSNYTQPFAAAWVWTGLLGYYEGKRWPQAFHWLALSFAIQAHPANVLLAPLSFLLLVAGWLRQGPERAKFVRATLSGWVLFAASLIPWGIGLISLDPIALSPQGLGQAASALSQPEAGIDSANAIGKFASLTGATGRRSNPALFNENGLWTRDESDGNWWPPAWAEVVPGTQALLTFVALLFLVASGWRRLPNGIPALLLASLGLWPLAAFLIPSVKVHFSYLVMLIFGAVPSLGVMLAVIADRNVWARRLVCGVVAVFVVYQVWLTVATVRDHYVVGNVSRFDAPMDTYLSALQTWNSGGGGREIIILAEVDEGKRGVLLQTVYWRIVTQGYPVRIVRMDTPEGLPIPPGGAVVAATTTGSTIPALFGPGNAVGVLRDGKPMYRWLLLPSPPQFPLTLYPQSLSLFANGARIVGVSTKQGPRPGTDWPVVLVWKVENTDVADNYSFSVRLVDEHGNRFGQRDGLSLDGSLWRAGDTVFNRLTLPVSAEYPGGPLRVQLLMYKSDTVPLVDEGGAPVASEMLLVPDQAGTDQLGWFEYHPAGRYVALTQHAYFARLGDQIDLLGFSVPQTSAHPGESIPVTLFWKAAQTPAVNYHVFVHLRDDKGNLVGQSDKANPAGSPTLHWTTTQYLADEHTLVIAPDTPPGRYQLLAGLWEESVGRANAYVETGALLGDSVPLGIFVTVQP